MKESVRSCLICRRRAPKHELLRVVWNGELAVDRLHNMPGRGAYLHPRAHCWSRIGEAKRWKQALRIEGELAVATLENLRREIQPLIVDQPPESEGKKRSAPPKIR